jgi:hypothetical protein
MFLRGFFECRAGPSHSIVNIGAARPASARNGTAIEFGQTLGMIGDAHGIDDALSFVNVCDAQTDHPETRKRAQFQSAPALDPLKMYFFTLEKTISVRRGRIASLSVMRLTADFFRSAVL